jgi:hypothetical protein
MATFTPLEERMVRQWVIEQDKKLEAHLHKEGATQAAPTSTTDPAQLERAQAIEALARAIGEDRILLPTAVTVHRILDDQGEIATSISFGHLQFTIAEAVPLGVLDLAGRFSHHRAGVLLHSMPQPGAWVRPNGAASVPATRPRF